MQRSALFLAMLLGVPSVAGAASLQNPDDGPPKVPSLATVRVTGVYLPGGGAQPAGAPVRAGIRDILVLKVANLDSLVRHAKCLSAKDVAVPACGKRSIVLYLDGREMRGLEPESGVSLPDEGRLQFHLMRIIDSVNNETWADLLGGPGLKGEDFYYRPAAVSVGLKEGYPLPTAVDETRFELIRLHRTWFIGSSIVFLVVLAALVWLAMYTGLLRDVGPEPTGMVSMRLFKSWKKKVRKPYSLGRVQMAFWFVLVIGAFLFIWLVTGAHDTITPSVLGLIGIGAGTGLGAAVIDVAKEESKTTELAELKAETTPLAKEIDDLEAAIKGAAGLPDKVAALVATRTPKQARLTVISERITTLEHAQQPQESKWFLPDILTDPAGGIGFHRFQMAVWTLVLGILFLRSAWERLAMPEFSATLLALLGISAGTYLGFKVPEKKV